MKKLISFFSFIALAVFAVSFTSCSKENEPDDPTEKYIAGSYKVVLTEQIFEYCDIVATLEYDGKTETFKMDDKTKVADCGMFTPLQKTKEGRVVAGKFTHKPGKTKLYLTFTLTEAGKKKCEEAGEDDSVEFAQGMILEANFGEQTIYMDHTYPLKHIEEQIKSSTANKIFYLEQ